MSAILILLAIHGGSLGAAYMGEFDSPAACQRAIPKVAEAIKDLPVVTTADAAALLCVPKREA